MRVARSEDGMFTVVCDGAELALIDEGLYAVMDAGERCLELGIPDEFTARLLEKEAKGLRAMREAIAPALAEARAAAGFAPDAIGDASSSRPT